MLIERRREPRRMLGEPASAILGPGRSASCIVADISRTGARLDFSGEPRLPKHFELVFAHTGKRHTVFLEWQAGRVAGIQFDEQLAVAERLKNSAGSRSINADAPRSTRKRSRLASTA